MRKRKPLPLRFAVLIYLLAGALILLQGGCRRRVSETVVGFPRSFADLAQKVSPSVVNISTESTIVISGGPFHEFFGQFGELHRKFFGEVPNLKLRQQSLGSGFIIDRDGYIITNNHVVDGAQKIKVMLEDGRVFKDVKVIGRDPKTDLALLKITPLISNLPVLALGNSGLMRPGDWVLAIGNPFGLEHTVTQGIISATGRVLGSGPYEDFLQTDAPINPGNSGGPLVNINGEVIGINTSIIKTGQGIGFAIPSNSAAKIVEQLKKSGRVIRGWIGVSIQSMTPELAREFGLKGPKGALVASVIPDGPAAKAGIQPGDVITSFNGKEVKNATDLPEMVAETPVGKTVDAGIFRKGRQMDVKIIVAEMK